MIFLLYHAIITATFSDTFDNKDCSMSAQMQEQQPETLQKQNSTQKKSLWTLALIIIIIVAAIAILFVWTLSILGSIPVFWAAIISAVLVVVPIVISLIGPLVSRDKP